MSDITIPYYEDRPTTKEEYVNHVGLSDVKPQLAIGDVVQYCGSYSRPTWACISGFELRVGGWYYHARTANPKGWSAVSFPEKDIIKPDNT